MKRPSTYVGQQVYEWAFSAPAQHAMTALAKVCQALFGTSTTVNGLACTPTSPAGMTVQIGAGEIYQMESLEATACGTLPADTTHTILKQGIQLDSYTTAAFTAPTSTGQSIAYLIEAQYQDSDISIDPTTGTTPVVLQFYNSTTPASPWSGPNNSGSTSNTFRDGIIAYSIKAGVAATTGSQVTPTPDSGYVGLWVVTVAYGQTTITASNIAAYSGSPVLSASLLAQIQALATQIAAKANTSGSSTQVFSVGPATANAHAVQKQQKALNAPFTSSGTLVVPAGVTQAIIDACAGGGGGGGSSSGSSATGSAGGGGGAGQPVVRQVVTVSPGETLTVTIGAAGAAGALATNGGTGGNTTIVGSVSGTLVSLTGGGGGNHGVNLANQSGGGGGGIGYPYGTDGSDTASSSSGASGGGGTGASGPFGGGGGGGRGGASAGVVGHPAYGYGSGGGGGGGYYLSGVGTGITGAAGAPGFAFIQW